ncbi:MAG: putative glycoside hydrolase [Patescibacteria group bacterium]|nr:putative glycoside hydrolase [Patescibacteria group bacterium]MCX7589349.1 putative glycoside hydrolase [Patescibacteria group bacterium]MDW8279712.1 putative glycoside hydrolase [bacterium]
MFKKIILITILTLTIFFLFYILNFKKVYLINLDNNSLKDISSLNIYQNKEQNKKINNLQEDQNNTNTFIDFKNNDLPNQTQLLNPPKIIKGIYATSWSAGSTKKINQLISIIKKNNLNAIVIDIKDYSGYVSYYIPNEKIRLSGALDEIKILYPNKLIKKLHDENIYVIGRITVFQDSVFAKKFPENAIKNKLTNNLWQDHKGLLWIDPKSKDYWNYILEISRDAWARGFDELNFDYIRFPSDGNLDNMLFPFWDGQTPKREIIKNFFSYLKENLKDVKISADVFGLTTIASNDLGIGQIIEDAYDYFDVVCPMIYPSHFANGSFGYKNPADYPYEVIYNSMTEALKRIQNNSSSISVLRPWLQVFDLGAKYDKTKINAQIKATEDVLSKTDYFGGYLLWDPSNNYINL